MLSLHLNTVNRFIGGLLLVSLGILAALLVLTFKGSAVPENPKPTFFNSSGNAVSTTTLSEIVSVVAVGQGEKPTLIIPVHLYPYQWQNQPIHLGAKIAGAVTALIGVLYVGLKLVYRNISREVFP